MIPGLMSSSSSLLVLARLLILYTEISAVSVESTFTVTDYDAENPLLYDVSLVTACDSGRTSPRTSQPDTDDQSFRIHLSFTSHLVRPPPRNTTASRKASTTSSTAVGAIPTSRAWSSIPLNPTTFPFVSPPLRNLGAETGGLIRTDLRGSSRRAWITGYSSSSNACSPTKAANRSKSP
jgi:hypothetical protein